MSCSGFWAHFFYEQENRMTIEELYSGRNVEDFYIGKITQVYRSCCVAQVDNVQLMSNREKFSTSFLPNTINYFVIIKSTLGLFLGEVFENKASRKSIFEMSSTADEKNSDYQEINIDTISKIVGMNITFVTSAKTDKEGYALLREFGLPFKK